jgi:hypothetical protein
MDVHFSLPKDKEINQPCDREKNQVRQGRPRYALGRIC